jgi:hypothetical protein
MPSAAGIVAWPRQQTGGGEKGVGMRKGLASSLIDAPIDDVRVRLGAPAGGR